MKKFLFYLIISVFAVSITVAQEQTPPADPIRLHEGIPIETGLYYGWITLEDGREGNPAAVDIMKNQGGIDVVTLNIERAGQVDTLINGTDLYNYGFDVMAGNMLGLNLNYVQHYTHAKYSVWEAEGDDNYGVNLQRNVAKTDIDNDGTNTFVIRRGDVLNSVDEMIYGPHPWYYQDVKYHGSDDGLCDLVVYRANFKLKLELNQSDPPVQYNPNDIICELQVTQSGGEPFCTHIIESITLTRNHFTSLNQFQTFPLTYNLEDFDCQDDGGVPTPGTECGPILLRSNVEFKVIWKGKSNSEEYPAYLLSVDKVTLSEERGQLLFVTQPAQTRALIESQAAALSQHHSKIAGYIGPDEPRSIDLFTPMKKVTEILDSYTQRERPL